MQQQKNVKPGSWTTSKKTTSLFCFSSPIHLFIQMAKLNPTLSIWGSAYKLPQSIQILNERGDWTRRAMASLGLQILGVALSSVGLLGSIMTCVLPMWRVTAFIGNNIVTAQVIWEGLWMSCVVQSTGHMQCKVYDSLLSLSPDLQAARALLVLSILLSVFGILLAVVGGKCTTCIENKTAKARVVISAGLLFLTSGLLCLTPVCWSAYTIIRDFHNPLLMDAQRRELGASLYTGWAATGLLLSGGAILCCQCPQKDERVFAPNYPAPKSNASEKEYVWRTFK